ncbi:DNA helicase RecQ [Acetonema longum]|uniref:DNA helicase RecQ n=1 Tax=Acetonema longum DSM 6540 TaxID=1009370 RepID=F7NEC0_9FIRM|nr:DNA helicase RecQ [Acetonema longum]EGO65632.1 ATP-dependent DNA helicase RecQ [Acetonema longum DSM 6540]
MLDQAQQILQKYYGYPSFRDGQAKIITNLLSGRDTLAIMPTGAGKSLCYQVPAMLFPGLTLVISPLISLMKDQVDALHSIGIPATFINSSLTAGETNDRIARALYGDFKLLYVAPERLESELFRRSAASLPISLLAIDEAHCVSQWGHDFRPSYRAIAPFISCLPRRPVIGAFTATATDDVRQDVIQLLNLNRPSAFITGFDRKNLSFAVLRGVNKQKFVLEHVAANPDSSGIIYATTRKEVDDLHDLLRRKGWPVGKYHAGMSDAERTQNQEAFVYDDLPIIAATNAFGMGIDKSNVRYVLHYNMPKNMEAYYQEAGRAGRDGEPGECILLFSPQDTLLQKYLIEQGTHAPERKANEFEKLQTMVDYCHTPRCLRKYILQYFGESDAPDQCGNCGNCNDDRELTNITITAQKIFSCILRMKERFGTGLVADVLKGAANKKVTEMGFSSLSTYGILKEYSTQEIKDLINLLAAEDYLYFTPGQYPLVKLTPKAGDVLRNQAEVWQKVTKQPKQQAVDNSLFALLRNLRREIASRENVPPYVVFADSTLREMCEQFPPDMESLRLIKGVGEVKLDRYGREFLQVILLYMAQHNIQPISRSNAHLAAPDKPPELPSHIITLNLFKAGKSLEEICQERDLKPVTVQDHLVRCSLEDHSIDWDRLIPAQYETVILDTIKKLGPDRLKPLKDALPSNITYETIKAVLCKHKLVQRTDK